ncbi:MULTISPECIES: cytochrome P450 [unclassified Streptomyces]|uniref:cytochrome P450 n=1 Tax=unclassified Streptomyces TaxID=2593676 RepID=UPI000DDB5B0A|nr:MULTISPECIES: cytochrome P450 [unclassified Streptomyces]QZZ25203.1 cytochrome P450 [Streptomyces sp. ST1015]
MDMEYDISSLVDGATYRAGNPFEVWQWMRENAPVLHHDAGEFGPVWSLTRYADIKAVLRDADTFTSSSGILLRPVAQGDDPGSDKTLALSDDARHATLRSAVAGWFAPRNLRLLTESMETAARTIVSEAVSASRVDFVTEVAARLPLDVVWTFFDIPAGDRAAVTGWSMDAFCATSAVERSIAHLEILEYFSSLALKRRERPGDDLVSVLAGIEFEGRLLPLEEVVLNCDNLLVGGTENVRIALSGGVHSLIGHPDQWDLLRDDFDRVIPTAVDEILRWTASATHLVRTARRDAEIGGQRIRRGDRVVLWLPSANRDADEFPDPDRFDLARTPNRHLSLGSGPHHCIGVQLAKLEIRAVLRELTGQVRRLVPYEEAERLDSIVVNGFRTLPVRLEPRASVPVPE